MKLSINDINVYIPNESIARIRDKSSKVFYRVCDQVQKINGYY